MKQIPLCNKCANAVMDADNLDPAVMHFIGCKASEHIHHYFDAKGNCPLLKAEKFDVTKFMAETKEMDVFNALDAIFLATKDQNLSITIFRALMLRYIKL